MADGKKSFVLYCDQIHSFEALDDAEAGRLIKHIFRYVNDQNPEAPDRITTISFEPIKHQLKRDLKKWHGFIEKQRDNGSKGGRPKNPSLTDETQKTQTLPTQPKKPANVNDNVNVNVNEEVGSEKVKEVANEVWSDQSWKNNICMGLSLSIEDLKKWLALFNSSVASDKIPDFSPSKYKKMSRGWISKQKANGTTIETGSLEKKSDSAPLRRLSAN